MPYEKVRPFSGSTVASLRDSEELAVMQAFDLDLNIEIELRRRRDAELQLNPSRVLENHVAYATAFPLRQFVKESFAIVEQGREFKENWHIDIICELLQAIVLGQVRNFIINIPRRTMKSTLVCVMFPCWVWTFLPHLRFLYTSYSADFAKRDNEKCRDLIASAYYQQRWGDQFHITTDRRNKIANTKGGSREVFKIGKGTGSGGDIVICLWYNTLITTDRGRLKIGDIVENKLDVKVLSFNHNTEIYEWEKIKKYEKSKGRKSVEITFSNGETVQCTFDHPFFIAGKGYVQANSLRFGDKIITHDSKLPDLPERVRANGEGSRSGERQDILLKGVFWGRSTGQEQPRMEAGESVQTMCDLPEKGISLTGTPSQKREDLLFQRLPSEISNRQGKFPMARWKSQSHLRQLLEAIFSQSGNAETKIPIQILFQQMQRRVSHTATRIKERITKLRILWEVVSTEQGSRWHTELLQSWVCEFGTSWSFVGQEQWQIHSWGSRGIIPEGIPQDSNSDSDSGWWNLPSVRTDTDGEWPNNGRSSYQLSERDKHGEEFNQPLPIPSRSNARIAAKSENLSDVFVESVKEIPTPEFVYNIQIPKNHNYFANGVLAHNCDDPNAIDEVESELILNKTNHGWNEVSYHNVSDRNTASRGIIQQRTSTDDLTGNITDDPELSKLYSVLCLAMRYEPDNPLANTPDHPLRLGKVSAFERSSHPGVNLGDEKLWIDPRDERAKDFDNLWYRNWYKVHFTDKGLETKGEGQLLWESYITEETIKQEVSHLKAYGESSQYQQRPIARGGNFFKSDDFVQKSLSSIDLNGMSFCRYWDKAATQDGGDWTVGMLVGRTQKRPYELYIIDIIRKQIGYYERMQLMKDTAINDTRDYIDNLHNTEYTILIEKEGGSGGKDVSTLERDFLLGHHVIIDRPKGKKAWRAKPAKSISEAGRIKVIKAPWNAAFYRELEKFQPEKEHGTDDQIDTLSGAVKFLIFGQTQQRTSTSGAR